MNTPHRIDWQRLIDDLYRAGLKPHVIAQRVGCARTTIQAYHNYGNSPLHQTGERLIEVWCEVTQRVRSETPRRAAESFIGGDKTLTA